MLSRVFHTLVKRHCNSRRKVRLYLHTLLGTHKNPATVNMRVEVHALLFDFKSEGSMLHLGSFASFVGGLEAAAGAAEGEHRSSMVLSASVLISCILAMIMALAGGLAGLPLPALALYQVAWAVLAMIFPLIQRY